MNKTYYVYILECSDGSYYTGHTDNLDVRIARHETGEGCDYTRRRRPVKLVWNATFPSRDQARFWEAQLKKWRREKKEAVIRGDWELLPELSKRTKKG